MHGKDAFDSMAERDLADRESRSCASMFHRNAYSLKHLDALLVTFLDLHVHFERIPGLKGGNVLSKLLLFHHFNDVHRSLTSANPVCSLRSSDSRLPHATAAPPRGLRKPKPGA